MLLPLKEFLYSNASFPLLSTRPIPNSSAEAPTWIKSSPPTIMLSHSVLSLASYILTHATASGSPRATAYAQLTLSILQTWVRDPYVAKTFALEKGDIRLCRQVKMRFGNANASVTPHSNVHTLKSSAPRYSPCQRKTGRSFARFLTAVSSGFVTTFTRIFKHPPICTRPVLFPVEEVLGLSNSIAALAFT